MRKGEKSWLDTNWQILCGFTSIQFSYVRTHAYSARVAEIISKQNGLGLDWRGWKITRPLARWPKYYVHKCEYNARKFTRARDVELFETPRLTLRRRRSAGRPESRGSGMVRGTLRAGMGYGVRVGFIFTVVTRPLRSGVLKWETKNNNNK